MKILASSVASILAVHVYTRPSTHCPSKTNKTAEHAAPRVDFFTEVDWPYSYMGNARWDLSVLPTLGQLLHCRGVKKCFQNCTSEHLIDIWINRAFPRCKKIPENENKECRSRFLDVPIRWFQVRYEGTYTRDWLCRQILGPKARSGDKVPVWNLVLFPPLISFPIFSLSSSLPAFPTLLFVPLSYLLRNEPIIEA